MGESGSEGPAGGNRESRDDADRKGVGPEGGPPDAAAAGGDEGEPHRELREAVEKGQFVLYGQPVLTLAEGRISGVEVLVRWRHPRRGLLSPAEFLPEARESGLIVPLGEWILEEALNSYDRWRAQGLGSPNLRMGVNFALEQLEEPDLPSLVERRLVEHGLSPPCLQVEVSDSELLGALPALKRLKRMGVQVAIDDFGAGYSSLAAVRDVRVDCLKLDRSFVTRMPEETDLVVALVRFARELGMRVTAEGVETRAQYEALREAGCQEAQGYFLARPEPVSEVELGELSRREPGA